MKDTRFDKGKKKKVVVLDQVEVHIPRVMAPADPIVRAKGVAQTQIWEKELLDGDFRKRRA